MVKKTKTESRKKEMQAGAYKWWFFSVVVFLLVILSLWGKNNPIVNSFIGKFMSSPTPTVVVKIQPPEGLSTDQASYVKLAVETLAGKLKIRKEDVIVVSVKGKQWNDSSLGCPQKGYMYIQSITPGYVIELSAREKIYIYNGGLNRVVSC